MFLHDAAVSNMSSSSTAGEFSEYQTSSKDFMSSMCFDLKTLQIFTHTKIEQPHCFAAL